MKLTWNDYSHCFESDATALIGRNVKAPSIEHWNTDSRKIQSGDWFIPLVGENFNGHQFIEAALRQGAKGYIYEERYTQHLSSSHKEKGILVQDTLLAFQNLARLWRLKHKNLTLFALTGSVGKTTTKEMLATILASIEPKTLSTAGNFNNEVGVPITLQRIKEDHKFAVVEMGARRPLDIGKLVDIAKPNIAACLNAKTAHIEIFKSKDAILKTKLEIFNSTSELKHIVFSHDDERIRTNCEYLEVPKTSFGYQTGADMLIKNQDWHHDGSLATMICFQGKEFQLRFSQGHSAYPINAAAALAMGAAAGLNIETMIEALTSFTGLEGRFNIFKKDELTIIDDCYNANPDSMKEGINTLVQRYPQQAKVVILGDMLELGQNANIEHSQLGSYCKAQVNPLFLIGIGEHSKLIVDKAISEGLPKHQTLSYGDVEDFLNANVDLGAKGQVVFIKGSNGVHLDRIVEHYC
ncbi:MAG: UDP-N-acetylmuramoyl-tripeptide--D-alanyl-D-alanine ligase [Oligoflexales bacterium]